MLSRRSLLVSTSAALASTAFARPAIAAAAPPAPWGERGALLDRLVDEAVQSQRVPGVALVVWEGGRAVYGRWAGTANLETGTAVDAGSVFRVGSISKQVTAVLLLQLAAQGRLALSDAASDHLPFLKRHAPFSLLELLQHTAGVHDGEYDLSGLGASHVEQARRIAQQQPFFDFDPGTAWLYSNANYLLAGAVIEQVAGKPLAALAAETLFAPLQLGHTAFDAPMQIVPGRVSGYTPTGVATAPFDNADYFDVRLAGAAGALRSTADDLCRWLEAVFGEGGLPAEFARRMVEPGRLRNGEPASTRRFSEADRAMGDTQYGLGLMLDRATRDQSLIVQHHGGINGFAAFAARHVPSGLSYACLCNADTYPGLPLRDVRRTIFRDILPIATG
ncbi:serine hydrolase domain-containing protein [Chiayiivirga flava]|uniref:CubicO group peptidase (Beta-lactamase class C family) n=1 Tax=Chiayiivirga flava TaxID=659595 RepID=A0A7W8G0K9_9GAMM|nr:serine hydrolase domain-containing protein [Chiayiivirga flava]MBB5207878.1 CubicO group peptidase (beta-lactamase class C family) [Chiayiivirga flava]